MRRFAAFPLIGLALSCGSALIEADGSSSSETDEPTGTSTTTTPSTSTSTSTTGPAPTIRRADIIVVVDNSGTMADEQLAAALGIRNLASGLTGRGVDYRIAFTTTDNGNPWCATGPEGGQFRTTSCLDRLEEFVFQGAQAEDGTHACLEACDEADIALNDPWVENIGGQLNHSRDELGTLACLLPQGIDGCGFEQPLESMNKAILRAETEGESQFGFHDPGALLAVLLITDELDCSTNPDHDIIFLPEGNRVFWSLPGESSPTSAVCWNAGVSCLGGGPVYGDCNSVDLNRDGEIAASEQSAVVRPVDRYTDALAQRGALFGAIVGVPDGYADLVEDIVYEDSLDPTFQDDFGIGPGCTSANALALPPVRIRELDDSLGSDRNLYSICSVSLDDAFRRFADEIVERLPQ